MRNAPSVTYPVGRSVLCVRLMDAVAGLGLLGVLVGGIQGSWRVALVCSLVWGLWVVVALWARQRMAQGTLAWLPDQVPEGPSGEPGVWSWASGAYQEGVALKRVERIYDLQRAMLLRLHNPDGARTWIWVERGTEPGRWLDLRRALVAHA
ncbi:hypothetical protein [Hydrogenophaga pseudoflava]|uniref:hypothetical protein n=1 Tax=Hydrogenophaga pseudoflava TaxID=47421 RepID=UPI0027E53457|nr:hypothetical protein [Hydrogenophaga pseudoflava]MDQ7743256.1 hypothetical protein [Hydrogenophaga pseudoflava]